MVPGEAPEARELIRETFDGQLWLTLNRPNMMNALTPQMVDGIRTAIEEAIGEASLRVVVITGTGRAFCAGADLKAALVRSDSGDGEAARQAFISSVGEMCREISQSPKPVIAAINGLAIAGGLEIALSADIVLASSDARFGDGHAKFGLLPGAGGSARLPRRIGASRAKYLMFTGRLQDAAWMRAAGLVMEIADPPGTLPALARSVAQEIAQHSPLGIARMKELIERGGEMPLEQALLLESTMSDLHFHAEDRKEGLRAFNEKRKPRFVGR